MKTVNAKNVSKNKWAANEGFSSLGIKSVNYGAFNGEWLKTGGEEVAILSPIDNREISKVKVADASDYEKVIEMSQKIFPKWSMYPAPKRGEIVRQMGEVLRKNKSELGRLITMEMGKILSEGEGEVQEIIDISDFAVGLSRQLYGKTMPSERAMHRMYEQWHPLGTVGVITAFNFPMAVWGWNTMIALVCGDTVIWKPSSKTPLCAIALYNILAPVVKEWPGVLNLVIGPSKTIGEKMINDKRIPLISATGSVSLGYKVYEAASRRMGRTILELGGNNAVIVMPSADIDLAIRAILFGAVGTSGQRCTTIRRVIIHKSVYNKFIEKLLKAYKQIKIGNPLLKGIMMGPLVDGIAVKDMMDAIDTIKKQGGKIIYGGKVLDGYPSKNYVEPCLVEANKDMDIVKQETFAPILYLLKVSDINEAIELHNSVPQGLSSSIFSQNLKEIELFLSARGSDCGIANVNMSTSGAEIGGAFGGEKETGGGRESGSDSWKQYMRRQSVAINWSDEMPLAQGIKFDI